MSTEQKSMHSCRFEHTLVHPNVMLGRIIWLKRDMHYLTTKIIIHQTFSQAVLEEMSMEQMSGHSCHFEYTFNGMLARITWLKRDMQFLKNSKLVKIVHQTFSQAVLEEMSTEQKSGHGCHFEHTFVHSNCMLARIRIIWLKREVHWS